MFADIHLLLLITFLNRRTREMIFSYQHSGSSRSSAAYDSSYSGHFHFCLTASSRIFTVGSFFSPAGCSRPFPTAVILKIKLHFLQGSDGSKLRSDDPGQETATSSTPPEESPPFDHDHTKKTVSSETACFYECMCSDSVLLPLLCSRFPVPAAGTGEGCKAACTSHGGGCPPASIRV